MQHKMLAIFGREHSKSVIQYFTPYSEQVGAPNNVRNLHNPYRTTVTKSF